VSLMLLLRSRLDLLVNPAAIAHDRIQPPL
jgi:hypothetical protein